MKKCRKLNKYDSVGEWNPKMRRPKDLTEEEVKAITNEKKHLTSSSDYINSCDKLRKVLKCE